MALKGFKKINTQDYELSTVQRNTAEFTQQLANNPRLDGLLIEDIALTSGSETTVNHGLGRAIRGFEIVYKNAQVDVWADDAKQIFPNSTLVLDTSATATISLWVF
jgi:hypothetical protein